MIHVHANSEGMTKIEMVDSHLSNMTNATATTATAEDTEAGYMVTLSSQE